MKTEWSAREGQAFSDIVRSLPAKKLYENIVNMDQVIPFPVVQTQLSSTNECERDNFFIVIADFVNFAVAIEAAFIVASLAPQPVADNANADSSEGLCTVNEWLRSGVLHLQRFLDQKDAVRQKLEDARFLTCTVSTAEIMNAFVELSQWLRKVKIEGLRNVMSSLEKETEVLKNNIPRYEHCVSSTRYTASLAKKNLCDSTRNAALAKSLSRVDGLAQSAKAAYCAFAVELKEWDDMLETVGAELAHAKTAMTLAAAVNVVEQMKGCDDAQAMASQLLAKHDGVVAGPLLKRLQEIAKAKAK